MSPLWPNQLLVSLSTEHVAVIYRAGLTKHVLNKKNVTLTEPLQLGWQTAISQFDSLLAQLQLPANTQMYITLASDLVRYLTLPAQQVMMKQAEKLAYANAAYREIYGAIAAEWRVKCHDTAPGRITVASAIDEKLYEAIQQLSFNYKLNLKTLQPYLMSVFNQLNRQVGNASAILAIVESNRLLLVNLQKGYCQQVRSTILRDDWQSMLNQTLTRETLLAEHEYREVLIYAPAQKNSTFNSAQGWRLKRVGITAAKINNESLYAMLEALA